MVLIKPPAFGIPFRGIWKSLNGVRLLKVNTRSKRFFYLLVVASVFIALFYSILLGLIVLIGDIVYYFYLGRSARKITAPEYSNRIQPAAIGEDSSIQPEVAKVHCKYCNSLIDPTRDTTCSNCGASVES